MSRQTYFDRFRDHTAVKHLLLETYLKAWATILLSGFERVWFVDAFAGAGEDDAGNPGSPLRAVRIARAVNSKRGYSPGRRGMHVVAIEKHDGRREKLKRVLAEYPEGIVRAGTLGERIAAFLKYVGNDPVLYFLDPFGLDGLDRAVVEKTLQRPHSEVLSLFSDEGAVRLRGKVVATPPSLEKEIAKVRSSPSLLGTEFDEDAEATVRQEVEDCLGGHASSRRALQILLTTFGGDWWAETIDQTPPKQRQLKFVELYEHGVLRAAGAAHVLRFDVSTSRDRHKYFLLHASKQKEAFAAMKDAISSTRRHTSQRPQRLLDVDFPDPDVERVADDLASWFAGQTVRWAETEGENIQAHLRFSSPLYRDQFQQLKALLAKRGHAVIGPNGKPARPEFFKF